MGDDYTTARSLIHFSLKDWDNFFFELGSERVKLYTAICKQALIVNFFFLCQRKTFTANASLQVAVSLFHEYHVYYKVRGQERREIYLDLRQLLFALGGISDVGQRCLQDLWKVEM